MRGVDELATANADAFRVDRRLQEIADGELQISRAEWQPAR